MIRAARAGVAVGGLLAAATHAQEAAAPALESPAPFAAPSVTLDAEFASRYVWRGLCLNADPVFQPAITVGWEGLSLSAWGSLDSTDWGDGRYNNREGRFAEIDYNLAYSHSFSKEAYAALPTTIAVTGGVIWYTFDGTTLDDTAELFAGIGLPDLPLGPTLTVYHDVDEFHGTYVDLAGSHSFTLISKGEGEAAADVLALVLGGHVAWADQACNEGNLGVCQEGFADAGLSVALPWSVGGGFTITPYVKHSNFLSRALRDSAAANADASSDQTVFGVKLSYSF
jgi:hypothetical protein